MKPTKIYSTLIGINAYPQSPLDGCIKDVLDLDRLLRDWVAQQTNYAYEPLYFLAPHRGDDSVERYVLEKNITRPVFLPTFESITRQAFTHFKEARDGDVCLLYYSGHGSQADAPPEFWHTKPDRQNETLVCLDSRDATAPHARDILDKELAYLLWDALEGKNVHCLVIMDCCHSGNNTRATLAGGEEIRYRHVPASKNKIPLHQYIGYDKGFYRVVNGKAEIAIAKYVHLAAARDSEKAQESYKGGLFTRKLLEVLRLGGTASSYRELVQGLTVSVNGQAEKQNPVAYARDHPDLDLQFLGSGIKPYQPSYEVRYDHAKESWVLFGGALHNIVPSSANAKTTVRIAGVDGEVKVESVDATTSVLDKGAMPPPEAGKGPLRAVISRMANPLVSVGLAENLKAAPTKSQELQAAFNNNTFLYFTIDFENTIKTPDYLIQLSDHGEYLLTKIDGSRPLFKREERAKTFLYDVEAVCKWLLVKDLKNKHTQFTSNDFEFKLDKVEGRIFTNSNQDEWDQFEGVGSPVQPGEEVVLHYAGKKQPAYRLSIALNGSSSLQQCNVGAVYQDPIYGIETTLLDTGARLVKGGSPLHLTWNYNSREYKTIPLRLDPGFVKLNINEVTAYLKIFVSNQPFTLERYQQKSLELDENRAIDTSRGPTRAKSMGLDNAEDVTDWTVFTFPIRIVGPDKEKNIEGGKTAEFSSFVLRAPQSFSASAFAATGNDLQARLQTLTRSADDEEGSGALRQMVMPPESIWGNDAITEAPFAAGMAATSDNGIQVLELMPVAGREGDLALEAGEELLITPKEKTRSIDAEGLEATTIPFGYDEAAQLYFPLGYADENGNIHIRRLPPATAGLLRSKEKLDRSIGSSVKLYFKKLFRRPQVNTLTLYRLQAGNPWQEVTTDPAVMKGVLEEQQQATVLLLLHGIIGDMKHITGALAAAEAFSGATHFVLAYDYENLATPIGKTAARLHEALTGAGFGTASHPHKICIIAHSMGGLVARCLIEKEGGAHYVQQAVLVGTPSGGSEVAALKESVLGLLTHALNVTGPLKLLITGLSFLLKKLELNPGQALEELAPGSDFLRGMATSRPPLPYYVIGGNTSLLTAGYAGDDFFLKKLAEAFRSHVAYPALSYVLKGKPNDMAVTLENMQAIQDFITAHFHEVASDHISYFTEGVCQNKMLELLACRIVPEKTETVTT